MLLFSCPQEHLLNQKKSEGIHPNELRFNPYWIMKFWLISFRFCNKDLADKHHLLVGLILPAGRTAVLFSTLFLIKKKYIYRYEPLTEALIPLAIDMQSDWFESEDSECAQ